MAQNTMPWQTESSKGGDEHFKYQYHPGGNPKNPPKDAPSALHSVIVPNVNLPKVSAMTGTVERTRQESWNEKQVDAVMMDADLWSRRTCMSDTTSGARMVTRWTWQRARHETGLAATGRESVMLW